MQLLCLVCDLESDACGSAGNEATSILPYLPGPALVWPCCSLLPSSCALLAEICHLNTESASLPWLLRFVAEVLTCVQGCIIAVGSSSSARRMISSRMAQGYYTARTQTCIQVLDKLRNVGAIMLLSPPASGKTSLCQLIVDVARKSSAFESAYYVNCAAVDSHTGFFGSLHRFNRGHPFEVALRKLSCVFSYTHRLWLTLTRSSLLGKVDCCG